MDEKKIIDSFFKSYSDYWEREIKVPEPIFYPDEEDILDWIKRTELHDGMMTDMQIKELENIYEGDIKFPDYYRYFLKSKSHIEMELPLINFPSNTDRIYELIEMTQRFRNTRLVPFAHSLESVGIYCIDLDSNMKILHWDYDDPLFKKDNSNYVISHFCLLLKIISKILDSQIDWYAKVSVSREKVIKNLKSIDQHIFGGSAWNSWWRDQICS